MTHQRQHWEDVLHATGHRVTRQRGLILDAVRAGGGHTSLGEIYARVRRLDASIDRSTLYRALHLFVDLGLVLAAGTDNGETRYEIARAYPHHHLRCRRCGGEWEIDDTPLHAMLDRILADHGFQVITDHLVLPGHCERCRPADGGV